MRKDMKKVLTERPRYGHRGSYKEIRRRENRGEYDNMPSKQGMRAPHVRFFGGKEFSDHIKPLIRFLWNCVGRRWNDVWSEICTQVGSGNTVDDHLKGHVLQEIDLHCFIENDKVFVKPKNSFRYRYSIEEPRGLYVDPRDGIIKTNATDYHNSLKRKSIREPTEITMYSIPGGLLEKTNGIWYSYEIKQCPPPQIVQYIEDGEVKTKKVLIEQYDERYQTTKRIGFYHTKKHQLSTGELKRYELKNEA